MTSLPFPAKDSPEAYQVETEYLTGVVERLTFHSESSGYTVARVQCRGQGDLVTVVGNFAQIQAGQTLQLRGLWRDHPQYGPQFQVTWYKETRPATLTGLEKYLGSGLIKGVGPVTAKRIVAHFGLETLDVIENNCDRLSEVPGIAKKRITMIRRAWQAQKVIKEVMLFLQTHGISTTYAVKIFKQYGQNAIQIVSDNPYQLAVDIYGIGFLTADKIARALGVSPWSKFRYEAALLHLLETAAQDGHCYLPGPELIEKGVICLSVENEHQATAEALEAVIDGMETQETLVVEAIAGDRYCYQPAFFVSEKHLAKLIGDRLARPIAPDLPRVRNWIERYTDSRGLKLSPQQQEAVETAAYAPMTILTGGPGTGKTFATRTIVALWKAMGKTLALAAPTGRAAQRLSEVSGVEAKTLHRLLEFDPKTRKFKRDEDNPLDATAVVVDESSMLDLFMAYALLKALPAKAQLLLVGDADQLPSVGPGNVLKDLIDCNCLPVVRLSQVFRQAATSAIVRAAHQINQGHYPALETVSPQPRSDCLWHSGGDSPEEGIQLICQLIQTLVPSLGFNPMTDVQVLAPMTKGVVGTRNFNRVLQQLINAPAPDKPEITIGGTVFRVGDRAIQLKNDYDREVFNGDLGRIESIDTTEQEVKVRFEERLVTYDYADLNELTLAWSISIHKSQGSEYPVVILPLYMQHYLMLNRNLVYTGLTRAKKLAIVVGPQKAISLAVRQLKSQERYTRLDTRIQELSLGDRHSIP